MTLAANALQAAIYTRLASQLPVPVFDFTPSDSNLPYVVIGLDTSIPWDTKGQDGQEYTVTIHVWDRAAGFKSTKTLMGSVYNALHHQESNLTATGFTVVVIRCEDTETLREQAEGGSDHYFHGVLRFRALIETN